MSISDSLRTSASALGIGFFHCWGFETKIWTTSASRANASPRGSAAGTCAPILRSVVIVDLVSFVTAGMFDGSLGMNADFFDRFLPTYGVDQEPVPFP